jgi:hypothetical protein
MATPDLDALLGFLLDFVYRALPEQGGLVPFGAASRIDGQIQPIAAYEGEAGSDEGHVELLIEGMRFSAQQREIIASGICTDVRVKLPGAENTVDAIQIHLEDNSGHCVDVFLPYRQLSRGEFHYGELVALSGSPRVFAPRAGDPR